MDERVIAPPAASGPLLAAAEWVVRSGLEDRQLDETLAGLADRLIAAGIPLARIQLGFRMLHPLFDFLLVTWTPEAGAVLTRGRSDDASLGRFETTPYYRMIQDRAAEFRRRLRRGASHGFPILDELAAAGATDYVAFLTRFDATSTDGRGGSAMASSWTTRAPDGFTDAALAALRWIVQPLGLTLKGFIKDQIARTALHTFHGPLVGNRILDGAIKRGAGERLRAVIWYSDLRNSTALADALSTEDFLVLLNAYFDCAAGAILDNGGQVLEIIGDAVLGMFPVGDSAPAACAAACRAASDAHRRLADLKRVDPAVGGPLAFGLGLHLGDVIFGNVGTDERLAFGLVGGVVNETARIETLTKRLGHPVLLADPVALALHRDDAGCAAAGLVDCGPHALRGVADALRLWALPVG
ncbi:MAG: adenylate/guanylate cyclase domain-containing protein [Proteobacteria bacterium]|nr:adenylate/guanylate cyclase domain-containing protein [Pseudomonadota bacterium]